MTLSRVSVIIAVHNGERTIREAVDSVLSQGLNVGEVVLVDDGSTDETEARLSGLPLVRYHWQPNAGQPAALNLGITRASFELLAFNDADDLWTPGRLRAQLAVLEEDPTLDAVFGHVEQFIDREAPPPPSVCATMSSEREVLPSALHTAMLIRRAAFERTGPFREDLRVGSVVEWADRARHSGLRSHLLPQVVLRRRLHSRNIGLTHRTDARADYFAIARATLTRRRKGEA